MLGGAPNSSNFAFFQAWIFLFFIFPSLGFFFVLKHPTCFLDGDLVGLGLATSLSVTSRDIIWWVVFFGGVGGREAQGPGDRSYFLRNIRMLVSLVQQKRVVLIGVD